jgi:YD repeat-containing protein
MKSILSIFIISILLISGCKDESTQPLDLQSKRLLHKTYSNPNTNTYTEYFYDVSDKLIMIESFNSGNLERRTEYEYNNNQYNIKESTFHTYFGVPENSYFINEYNGQGLLSNTSTYLKMFDSTYELRSNTKYEYDVNKKLIKSSIFNTDSVEVKYTLFNYDGNGNVIETNFYQNGSLSFNDKYEYDNMNNPLRQVTALLSVYTISKNNVIKHSQINYMMGNDFSTTEYTYQYNKYGYPISCSYDSQKYYFDYY